MRKPKTENEKISVQMTLAQKNQLERFAALENKSVSAYVRDIIFSSTLDTAKIDFYKNINEDLIHLKRYQYAMSRLLMIISSEQIKPQMKIEENSKETPLEKAQKTIMKFYNACLEDANKKF